MFSWVVLQLTASPWTTEASTRERWQFWPPHHFPLHQPEVLSLIIHTLTLNLQVRPLRFGSRRSSTEDVTERGLWPFSQAAYRAPFVAVDCIALNYW